MKRLILITIGIVFVIAAYSQNTYFYYYKNARQYLNLNTKYAYIAGDTLDIENFIYYNSSAIENPDSLSYSNGYTIIEFKGELSESDYLRMLHRINNRYNLYAEPYFSNNSSEYGLPELPVKYINLLIPKGTKPIFVNINHISSDSIINLQYKLKTAELFESDMSLINQDVDSLSHILFNDTANTTGNIHINISNYNAGIYFLFITNNLFGIEEKYRITIIK